MLATKIGLVILSEAKDLCADRDRPFASLRVTGLDLAGGTELDLAVDEELSRSFEPALIN